MRAYFFILFVCPVVMFAQNQQVPPANGSTDCPTFGKKNTSTKAGFFQYMRTNKPPKTEQQTVYRNSALPTLKPTAEEETAIALRKQKRAERAAARRQRQAQDEPTFAKATADKPVAEEPAFVNTKTDKPAKVEKEERALAEASAKEPEAENEASIENESSAKDDATKRAEERDKKYRKAANKEKVKRVFKKTNKPSSRKNVQKCPQF